jgi:polar amino acid transport system permease protein
VSELNGSAVAAQAAPTVRGDGVGSARVILVAAGVACLSTVLLSARAAAGTLAVAPAGIWRAVFGVATIAVVCLALATFIPVTRGWRAQRASSGALVAGDLVSARKFRHRAAHSAWVAMGTCLALSLVALFTLFLLANDQAVQVTFFDWTSMVQSAGDIFQAFKLNVVIALGAEALVLAWGLVVAIARLLPGDAGRPIRWLATAYVDIFRAVPAIIVIYLIGFGLPLAGVPVLSSMDPLWAVILALTLTYGAYVAEVYRAGIESIHWSQVAAARSLGLSFAKSLRFVVVPQAVRRVTPPLLNDFIGLQKDTALASVIGVIEAFNQAKIYASNYFNLSSVTVVAALFVVVTIPQTRFVDRLLARDARRQRTGG